VPFVTDTDVAGLQARLGTEWTAIAQAASAASSKLSPEQLATLGTLATRFQSFMADSPSLLRAGVQMTTGESLERDAFSFADSLRASGVPGLPAAPSEGPKTPLDKALDLVPYVLLAFALFELGPLLKKGR
jgi:hypothetical protein